MSFRSILPDRTLRWRKRGRFHGLPVSLSNWRKDPCCTCASRLFLSLYEEDRHAHLKPSERVVLILILDAFVLRVDVYNSACSQNFWKCDYGVERFGGADL